jgi:hypothetical protein
MESSQLGGYAILVAWLRYERCKQRLGLLGTVSSGAPRMGEMNSMGTPTGLKCGLSGWASVSEIS